jgi:hypothetical protein
MNGGGREGEECNSDCNGDRDGDVVVGDECDSDGNDIIDSNNSGEYWGRDATRWMSSRKSMNRFNRESAEDRAMAVGRLN